MHENRDTSGAPRSSQDRGRPEKALNHKSGMHASEESDRGIIPMSQPNNEDVSSEEVGEGRLRTKENIDQPHRNPTQGGEHGSKGLAGGHREQKEGKQNGSRPLLTHLTV